ncbi:LysR family transcriptional regulator [Thalassospira sp.]|uniref:LysR family transcriptional regulator n=1 Tax=Thalassospira sp. TaxID=1912094 RepID=UPI0032EBF257
MQALLDLKLLTTFVRAAHAGTLSAAAIQVGRTQSTVTMQIQRLEDALGQTLFHRSGSGVRLTGAGDRFLGYAERILRLHDDAISSFSDQGLRGAITFGCPEDYLIAFFPALLKSFGSIYPDVEIKVVSAPTPELQKLLHARQIDMALVSTPDITPATAPGRTPNTTSGSDTIRTEQLAWVGSKPTLELHDFGKNITLNGAGETNGNANINTDTNTNTKNRPSARSISSAPSAPIPLALPAANAIDHRSARDAMQAAGLPHQIAYASNSLAGLIAVTRSGLAISVMMQKAVPSDLFILKSPLPPLPKLGLRVVKSEFNPTPATDAFADHISKMLPFL